MFFASVRQFLARANHPASDANDHTIILFAALFLPAGRRLIARSEQEDDMERGLIAPLSPNEESALRRVAHGISKPKHLRDASVERLKLLALVEEQDGRIRLTDLGAQRFSGGSTPNATA
jgi:hypothetical protein